MPFLGSLKLTSSNTGLPKLRVKIGLQMEAFFNWSPLVSLEVLVEVDFCGCLFSSPGFFSWGLVGGLCNLPLLSTLGALASLSPLPFLVLNISGGHVCSGRGGWSGHHCHGWGRAPSMGREQDKQVWGLLFETHVFRGTSLWWARSVFVVENLEVFVYHFLNIFESGLLVFAVWWESQLLGVEEFGS